MWCETKQQSMLGLVLGPRWYQYRVHYTPWWIQAECQGSVLLHSQTLMHVSTRDWEQDCTTSQTELYRAIAVKGPAESNLLSRGRGGVGGCVFLLFGR